MLLCLTKCIVQKIIAYPGLHSDMSRTEFRAAKFRNPRFGNSKFRNKAVRDLAWAISTPPIISSELHPCCWPTSSWYQSIYKETLAWFNELDRDCSSLDSLLAKQKDRRLGKYFEILWFYWLSHHPRYEVLAHNLQIIIDGETLGEMDFILFDKKNKQVLHWEVAVKFYLGVDDTAQMQNWHGPNLRDRLDVKVDHLLHKQSTISKDARVAEWLRKQGFSIDRCAVILKGRLYYHWHQFDDRKVDGGKLKTEKREDISKDNDEVAEKGVSGLITSEQSPAHSSVDHLRSCWFRKSEFNEYFPEQQHFSPLINRGWLAGLSVAGANKMITKGELFKTLSNDELRLPMHLQLYRGDKAEARIFLVEDNWAKNS